MDQGNKEIHNKHKHYNRNYRLKYMKPNKEKINNSSVKRQQWIKHLLRTFRALDVSIESQTTNKEQSCVCVQAWTPQYKDRYQNLVLNEPQG